MQPASPEVHLLNFSDGSTRRSVLRRQHICMNFEIVSDSMPFAPLTLPSEHFYDRCTGFGGGRRRRDWQLHLSPPKRESRVPATLAETLPVANRKLTGSS